MPYTTERGVRIYHDHDTPPEFASAADEDRHIYNEERDRAFNAAEELAGLLDRVYGEQACDVGKMRDLADAVCFLLGAVKTSLSGGAP